MPQTWTQEDFNELDWCNSEIHAIEFCGTTERAGSIRFDIDYVLEWDKPQPESPCYRVASADLVFLDVRDLRISIDFSKMFDGSSNQPSRPIRIQGIERESWARDDQLFAWQIAFYDMEGSICFESKGFRQTLTSEIVNCHSQIHRGAG